jgi:FBP C-terminal treble-clef zinc-finger
MRPLTDREIRAAFVNCSKGEAARLHVPRDLATRPWDDLDFLGWRDPKAPERACLVVPDGDRLTALVLRCPAPSPARAARRGLCSLCLTTHDGGVPLMVAPKAGKAGRNGDSVGTYICGDLACPLYVRLRPGAGPGTPLRDSLGEEERIARMLTHVTAFVAKVTS